MDRYRKPLVLVCREDDPATAVRRAIRLASGPGSELTLLQVRSGVPLLTRDVLPERLLEELVKALREEQADQLGSIERAALEAGVSVRSRAVEGDPFLIAIREVVAGGHDLLVKAATTDLGAGTTDKHLLRKCPCPVWLVAPGSSGRERRIVAAVEPEPKDADRADLALRVLESAVDIARMDGAPLDVLNAWHLFGESILRSPHVNVSDPEVDHIVGNAFNRHAAALDSLLEQVPAHGVTIRRHLVRGAAAQSIVSFVGESAASLLVIGTVGRSGIPGLIIGNTAERVLDAVGCSVLALKPRDFRSPVQPVKG